MSGTQLPAPAADLAHCPHRCPSEGTHLLTWRAHWVWLVSLLRQGNLAKTSELACSEQAFSLSSESLNSWNPTLAGEFVSGH